MDLIERRESARDDLLTIPRAFDRREVEWEAVLDLGDRVETGVVRDYSAGGVFWSPRVLMVKPLPVGARGKLRILGRPGQEEKCDRVDIRWVGHSPAHSCFGFGLQFDKTAATP